MNNYNFRGKEFTDVEEYAKYILKCKEDDRVKAEKERQDKLRDEKEKRKEELVTAYNEYVSTCKNAKEKYLKISEQFDKDYGNFCVKPYMAFNEMFANLDSFDRVFKL